MSPRSGTAGVALDGGERRLTFAELEAEADRLAERLRAEGTRVLATLMDNSPAWVVADLAAARARRTPAAAHAPPAPAPPAWTPC